MNSPTPDDIKEIAEQLDCGFRAYMHKIPLSEAKHVYDIFNKREDGCVKVVLKP